MEIKKSVSKINHLKDAKRKITKRKIILYPLLFIFLVCFGMGAFYYGAQMYSTGRYYPVRMLAHRIVQGDFSFFKNKAESYNSDITVFDFDIKFVDLEKLRYNREKAIKQNIITDDLQDEVPAKIRINGESYKVNISLTGLTLEHVQHPEKWSFSIDVKDGKTILGMKKFALLVPLSRGYLTDWTAQKILNSRNVISGRTDFIDVNMNGKSVGVYYLEERFDKLMIENNRFREGIIFKIEGSDLNVYGEKKIRKNPEMYEQYVKLNQLWYAFLNDSIPPEHLFDMTKLASTAVVSDLMNEKHAMYFTNMRFYYNPVTCLVEPIAREWGIMQKESKKVTRDPFGALLIEDPKSFDASVYHKDLYNDKIILKIYDNLRFQELYIKEAAVISRQSYLDSILDSSRSERNSLLSRIYVENPFYEYPVNILHNNQKHIREKINPKTSLPVISYNKISNDTVFFDLKNKTGLPIEIRYYEYNSKTKIYPAKRIVLKKDFDDPDKTDNIYMILNDKISSADFEPEKLSVYYSILGLRDIKKAIVDPEPYYNGMYKNLSSVNRESNLNEFDFLKVDNNLKTVEFSGQLCKVKKDMIIPDGYSVTAQPGCVIDEVNSAKIISFSPLFFFGKEENVIKVVSSDSTGQGLIVLNSDRFSEFSHVIFKDLRNHSDYGWHLTGAVTFYESPVNFNNCTFNTNFIGDDFTNFIRTEFSVRNSTYENTNADAFDADFCKGEFENVKFHNVGNDGIDISGSEVLIKNVTMSNIGDKGVSVGESSHAVIDNVAVDKSEIGVCAKDNSTVKGTGISISNSQVGFCVFQKKPEYGPGLIDGRSVKLENVFLPYLIENNSRCFVDGQEKISNEDKVRDILYGVKFGKASK